MPTNTNKSIRFFKIQRLKRKKHVHFDGNSLFIGQRQFIAGPAFTKRWKRAAIEVCASFIEAGTPSFIVESEDYFTVWKCSIAQAPLPSPTQIPPQSSELSGEQLPQPLPMASTSSQQTGVSFKKVLSVSLPFVILAAIAVLSLRPRDACRIALDGSYDPHGLSQWVSQALQQQQGNYLSQRNAIMVSQYGCTIVVKGYVPTVNAQNEILAIAKSTQVRNDRPNHWFLKLFQSERTEPLQPVAEVINQLEIGEETP
ncbi:hypothetical protein [Lyngbya confervoides]|uniref:BON domain-containing protein n=1 Tax=Lyngbya confervoides BDU141951 TaxID=1574623 RepID=A0ABD4T5V7_9CYAN|nr:hypothetical protein [Lyngbya confervoides]MCM1984031.1 hypothetical protein [Lyngbya confervoides BDU141951]